MFSVTLSSCYPLEVSLKASSYVAHFILALMPCVRLIVNLDVLIVSVCLVDREGHLTEIWQLLLDSLPEFKLPEIKPEEEVKEEVNPEQLAPVSMSH